MNRHLILKNFDYIKLIYKYALFGLLKGKMEVEPENPARAVAFFPQKYTMETLRDVCNKNRKRLEEESASKFFSPVKKLSRGNQYKWHTDFNFYKNLPNWLKCLAEKGAVFMDWLDFLKFNTFMKDSSSESDGTEEATSLRMQILGILNGKSELNISPAHFGWVVDFEENDDKDRNENGDLIINWDERSHFAIAGYTEINGYDIQSLVPGKDNFFRNHGQKIIFENGHSNCMDNFNDEDKTQLAGNIGILIYTIKFIHEKYCKYKQSNEDIWISFEDEAKFLCNQFLMDKNKDGFEFASCFQVLELNYSDPDIEEDDDEFTILWKYYIKDRIKALIDMDKRNNGGKERISFEWLNSLAENEAVFLSWSDFFRFNEFMKQEEKLTELHKMIAYLFKNRAVLKVSLVYFGWEVSYKKTLCDIPLEDSYGDYIIDWDKRYSYAIAGYKSINDVKVTKIVASKEQFFKDFRKNILHYQKASQTECTFAGYGDYFIGGMGVLVYTKINQAVLDDTNSCNWEAITADPKETGDIFLLEKNKSEGFVLAKCFYYDVLNCALADKERDDDVTTESFWTRGLYHTIISATSFYGTGSFSRKDLEEKFKLLKKT